MTVLGCGTMGIAILNGILSSLAEIKANNTAPTDETPARLPSKFIACVRSEKSADRIKTALGQNASGCDIIRNKNVECVKNSDVVLLACKPYMVNDVLGEVGMAAALKGKILVSVCAGITVEHMEKALHGEVPAESPEKDGRCRCIRAMFNTAALVRQSMTVIATPSPPLSAESDKLITWIFKQIGDVVVLPSSNMDAATALCGSGPAFFTLMLEAAIDGGVAMGLPRAEAQRMAAQTMRGVTGLVQSGEHPAILREKVCTPGGCTIGG
ncbi:hypothetical protein Golomagni_06132 [Golovinomyces magnicellulatus]|nr:hypothetical protein Golomagni_06132 [Golovinomyces magnicellulatus]